MQILLSKVSNCNGTVAYHCEKRLSFSCPQRDGTNQTLPGRELLNYSTTRESLFSDIPAGDRKNDNFFYRVSAIGYLTNTVEHILYYKVYYDLCA